MKKLLSLFLSLCIMSTMVVGIALPATAACALPLPNYPAGTWYGSGECWSFANLVYQNYWGYAFDNSQYSSDNMIRNVSIDEASRRATAANLKKYISECPIGSCVRISRTLDYVTSHDGDAGHSFIVVDRDANGFTCYDIMGGYVCLNYRTYDYYAQYIYLNGGLAVGNAYIKYVKAGSSTSTPTVSQTENCKWRITVAANSGKIPLYDSAATYVESDRWYNNKTEAFGISCTQKVTLSNGEVRYYFYIESEARGYYVTWNPNIMTIVQKHAWSSWTTTKSATCTDTGTKERTCSCGETETQTIAALGHTYTNDSDTSCNTCGEKRNTFCYNGLEYGYLDDGTLEVVGYETEPTGKLVIPATVYGTAVTSIGEKAFYNCDSLTNVTIPDGVTIIGKKGFYSCDNLTRTTIPDSVTSIGEWAFAYCKNLANVNIPKEVTSIESYTFISCDALTSIAFPYGLKTIGNDAFFSCDALTSVTIPKTVLSIGDWAFYSCDALTEVWSEDNIIYEGGIKPPIAYMGIGSHNECFTSATWHEVNNSCDSSCNDCGAMRLVFHEYDSVITYPTCVKDGYITDTCAVCGDRVVGRKPTLEYALGIHLDALGHSYKAVVTLPTATAQGYTTYTCANCGDSYKDNYTPATGPSANTINLKATASDTGIVVTWEAPEGIKKYQFYLKNAAGEQLLTKALDSGKTSLTLSWPNELEWGETYQIGIRPQTTKWLDTVYVTSALELGNRIVDVKTESVGRTIKVNWQDYEGATQYYVYVYKKGAYSEGAITSVKATTNSATIINAINPEIDYEVRVIATKGVPKMATVDALSINARLGVFTPDTFTERGITPTKVGIGFDEVRGADKYWVYLTPLWSDGAEIIKESTKAIAAVAGLAPSTAYTVQIQARITDADGKTHYSGKSEVLGTITTDGWQDISFTAEVTKSGAELNWIVPNNAYSYIIYRSTNGGKSYKKLATITDATITSCVDAAGKDGYLYAIVMQLQDDFVTTKSPLIKAKHPLDVRFEDYTKLMLDFGYFNSQEELRSYSASSVMSTIFDYIEPVSTTEIEGEYEYYTSYVYSISDLDAYTLERFNYTWDYSVLDGEIVADGYDCSYDSESNTLTLTTMGGWGGPRPWAIYEGYEKVDDTHYVITYDEEFEGEILADNVKIEVEIINGKYIITAHHK